MLTSRIVYDIINSQKRKQWLSKKQKEKYLEIDEEARESGEYVPYYTEKELESVVMEYLNDRDDFSIEYDGETDTEAVVC